MNTEWIYNFMNPHRNAFIQAEILRLREKHAPHYQEMAIDELERRAARLVEAFLGSLKDGPIQFVQHIDKISKVRFSEGYFLEEIQSALNILAEKTWEITESEVPLTSQVEVLRLITCVIGAAKDQLARVYFKKLERHDSRMARLMRQE